MKILGISGSLRKGSFNTLLLEAAVNLVPANVNFEMAEPLDRLPHFNPDLDDIENPLPEVRKWREDLNSADALVIASPEYAHAISGVLKNAIDWVVGSGELVDKPVMVLNASPTHLGAEKAHAALKYTINLLSALLVEEASFQLSSVKTRFNQQGKLIDTKTIQLLKDSLARLAEVVRSGKKTEIRQEKLSIF